MVEVVMAVVEVVVEVVVVIVGVGEWNKLHVWQNVLCKGGGAGGSTSRNKQGQDRKHTVHRACGRNTVTQAPYHTNATPHHCPKLPTYRRECRRGAGDVRRGHVDAVDAEAGDCVHTVPLVPLHQYTQVLPTARGEPRQQCGGGAGDGRGGLAPGHTHTHIRTHTYAHTRTLPFIRGCAVYSLQ